MYVHESIIIHWRTPESCKLKRRLRFKLHDLIICEEQTVLESIKDAIEEEYIQTQ